MERFVKEQRNIIKFKPDQSCSRFGLMELFQLSMANKNKLLRFLPSKHDDEMDFASD